MRKFFKDRADAARKLIPMLAKYAGDPGVVLAVPRGGVPLAYHIAKKLLFPLDLLMAKKIGHPSNPEFAVGAVSANDVIIDRDFDISPAYIENMVRKIRLSLNERYRLFMGDKKPLNLKDKTVIIVDDGVATGNTILSAIAMIRKQKPKKIIVAVPVSSRDAAEKIAEQADDFVCVYLPREFRAVGHHYEDFSEVSDEDVMRLLKEINNFPKAA